MLTALGTIDALDVDAVPRALGRAGSPPPLGRVLPPGAGSASGCRRFFAAARERGADDLVRHELGPVGAMGRRRASTCSGSPTCSCRTPRRRAGSRASTTSRRPRWRSRGPGPPGRSDGGPIVAVKLGADGALACQGGRHGRPRPGDAGRPGRHDRRRRLLRRRVPAGLARRRGPPRLPRARRRRAAPCRPGRPAAWTPSRRSPRRGRRWRPGRPADGAGPRRRLLFVAANPSIDRLYELDRLTVGEIHRPASTTAVPGGKGLNAARAAAALGGDGDRGRDRRRAVRRLDRGPARRARPGRAGDPGRRGDADLRLDPRPLDRGADRGLRAGRGRSSRPTGRRSRRPSRRSSSAATWPRSRSRGACRRARRPTASAGSPACAGGWLARPGRRSSPTPTARRSSAVLAERPALVKVNAAEAGEATGVEVTDARSAAAAADALRDAGAAAVIVTLGRGRRGGRRPGGAVPTGRAAACVGPYPVGSGDAFLGGLAVAIARGEDAVGAARLGCAAGIANAQVPGAGQLDAGRVPAILEAITVEPI